MNLKKASVTGKIVDRAALQKSCAGWRVKNKKIVFTNGCFDLLHAGHVALLLEAAAAGNKLVVGLNSDRSVQRLKGPGRPLNRQEDRALLLAAQTFVDAVVIFEEDTPLELIKAIAPDVLVKGGDYSEASVVGADFVQQQGGEVRIVPLLEGYSTTGQVTRIRRDAQASG